MQYVPVPIEGVEVSKELAKIIAEDFRNALPLVEDGKQEFICWALDATNSREETLSFMRNLLNPFNCVALPTAVGEMFRRISQEAEDQFWQNASKEAKKELRVAFLKYHIKKFENYCKE
jgi:hypothetical protein